jgi:hypothetical protein
MRALWAPRTSFFYQVAKTAQRLLQGSVARPCPYVFAADPLTSTTLPYSYTSHMLVASSQSLGLLSTSPPQRS